MRLELVDKVRNWILNPNHSSEHSDLDWLWIIVSVANTILVRINNPNPFAF